MKNKPFSLPLPPFKPDAVCPKCGLMDIRTIYCGPHRWHSYLGMPCEEEIGIEHFHRVCSYCEYSWVEATLETYKYTPSDSPQKEAGAQK